MATQGDEAILAELKRGGVVAFKKLFDAYSSLVFNVALRMLRNRQDAEDITQDVFLHAYKSLAEFRCDSKLSTWLYRIAVNRSLNFLRKKKHERWLSLDFASGRREDPSEVLSLQENPQESLERTETERIVRDAIDSLPKMQRTAMLLHRYEGLSYEEIAEIMNVSVASVESRLHRTKQALAIKLISLKEKV